MSEDLAKRDQNYVPTMQGVSSLDGVSPTDVHVDPITNEVLVKTNVLLPTEGNNPSTTLSYDIDGNLQYIDETIGAKTYRTTLTYTSGVLTGVSEAVEL